MGPIASGLDLTWVDGWLALGGAVRPVQVPDLRAAGIRRVVDLRAEECDDGERLARHGIELLHLPTPDLCPVPADCLDRGVAWAVEGLERDHGVLIHCQHGIGRSALLCCCVMVARGLEAGEALRRMKQARARVSPSPAQLEALIAWVARREAAAPAPTWAELADIAYAA
jgi:protein-tyrosine phosphatase